MREDYLENIEKMFPEGYAILYSCKDGQVRMGAKYPRSNNTLSFYVEALVEMRRQILEERQNQMKK